MDTQQAYYFFSFALYFFLIGEHAKTGCTNEWNGGTYLRARWAFVLKREREKMKNRLRLGSGSELCVAAPPVSPWLCAAHCTDCICLWIGYEANLPGKAWVVEAPPVLTVYCNRQTAIWVKIFYMHTCSTLVVIRRDTEPIRQEAIPGYETVSRPAEADCSRRENLLPLSARLICFP